MNEVKRADEMERKLRFFSTLIKAANENKDLAQQPIVVAPNPTDGRDRDLSMDELEVRTRIIFSDLLPWAVHHFFVAVFVYPVSADSLRRTREGAPANE